MRRGLAPLRAGTPCSSPLRSHDPSWPCAPCAPPARRCPGVQCHRAGSLGLLSPDTPISLPGHPACQSSRGKLHRPAASSPLALYRRQLDSSEQRHAEPTDPTTEILKAIRDEVKGVREEVNGVRKESEERPRRGARDQRAGRRSAPPSGRDRDPIGYRAGGRGRGGPRRCATCCAKTVPLRDRVDDHERRLAAVEHRAG